MSDDSYNVTLLKVKAVLSKEDSGEGCLWQHAHDGIDVLTWHFTDLGEVSGEELAVSILRGSEFESIFAEDDLTDGLQGCLRGTVDL